MSEGYSGKRTAEIVGITYRQLDYWARTDLIRPSISDASGSGSRRLYGYGDLLELRVVKQLLDSGLKLENVRHVFAELRRLVGEEIATANLVIDGTSASLALDDGQLLDLLHKGQGVLNVMNLGQCQADLDARIVELRGPVGSADSPALSSTGS
ncbi:MAG: MerR family transcriptional regulator [Actinomycetota bacterium]|nr:MerR family transcriptional regulator [Actinomycetota bacterium]